jgi:hypothetical protein
LGVQILWCGKCLGATCSADERDNDNDKQVDPGGSNANGKRADCEKAQHTHRVKVLAPIFAIDDAGVDKAFVQFAAIRISNRARNEGDNDRASTKQQNEDDDECMNENLAHLVVTPVMREVKVS